MSGKFQNKYRKNSIRLQQWDYGWNAAYFITICTHNRICYFGNVTDGQMVLNNIGEIANDVWLQIPDHFPFARLGEHIVMPNHVHGIVVIDKPDDVPPSEARLIAPLYIGNDIPGGITGYKNPMLHQNVSRIIRWYKGRTTFESRKTMPRFTWQPKYYDHIIRNNQSFQRISAYIVNNPLKWRDDQFRI